MSARLLGLVPTILLLFLLAALPACSGGGADGGSDAGDADSTASAEGEEAGDEEDDAVPVQVVALSTGPMEAVVKSSANLEAERSVQVFAEASRRVVALLVEEGDVVAKGAVLCRLQDDEQQSALGQAKALLDKYAREKTHQESLHARGLTTDKALNDAISDWEQQRLRVEDAERQLGYTRVRAPIAGTVTMRMVKVGDYVTTGQHLFDMVDFDSLVALVYVPEKSLAQLRPGLDARVTAKAVRAEPYSAKVDRVAPVVDARSGTVKVTVAVGGQPGLRPGLFSDVEIITATNPNALLVPKRALVYDNDQIFLYRVVADDTVERVPVVPKLSDRQYVEPVSGFAAGDRVVIAGQAGLKHGSRVEVVTPGLPNAEDRAEPEAR